jgi:hypothetical protein
MMRNAIHFPVLAALLTTIAAAAPATSPKDEHVRGDIVAVSGNSMKVKTPDGQELTLTLAPDLRVSAAQKASLDSVGQGLFVGTTAVAQADGTLRAVEVHVFPESMRGTGEGHRPWDLQPESTMTNATVEKSELQGTGGSAPTMTNATVAEAGKSAGGRRLQLKYPGGEKTVFVPANTPVVRLEPSDRSKLKAGEHVFAVAARQPDGTVVAKRVIFGEAVVPPM